MKVIHFVEFFETSSFTRGVLICEQKVPNKLNTQKLDHKQLKRSVWKKQDGNVQSRRYIQVSKAQSF